MNTFEDNDFGLERLAYNRFRTTYMVRRPSQAPTKFDKWAEFQLPTDSVLHTVNGFDTLAPRHDASPDPDLPVVVNEKLPVRLLINTNVADEDSQPFGVKENYIYRRNSLAASIMYFYKKHPRYHRALSEKAIGTMRGTLAWMDYSPLNEIKVNGTIHDYRKFDLIFRTILNAIVRIGSGRHHFILLPQGGHVFKTATLQRTYKELSVGTLGVFNHDPSIFPIIHLLGFAFGRSRSLSVKPYKEDLAISGKSAEWFNDVKSSSLFERLDPSILESINLILQKDDRAVVYNLADVAKFSEDSSFYNKLYRHVMSLRLGTGVVPDHVDTDSEQFDSLVDNMSGTEIVSDPSDIPTVTTVSPTATNPADAGTKPAINPTPAPAVVKPVSQITPVVVKEDIPVERSSASKAYEEKVRTVVADLKPASGVVDNKIESKRNTLIEQHFRASLGGKPIGELIQSPPRQAVSPKQMDYVRSAPEISYRKSSLIAMDQAYQREMFHHEMAKVLGSLAKHGLFIQKIEEDKTHTEMDRVDTYKVSLQDLNGKAHNIKFTLPNVDERGIMKLGGTEYRLTRQIANIPICKVSPTRVNLSSYYNKIIVERSTSKRNSYEQVLNKLILMLRSEGRLEAVVGTAPSPTMHVPHDYTAIGMSFTKVVVGEYDFRFNGDSAPLGMLNFDGQDLLSDLSAKYGTFVGTGPDDTILFWDKANQIHQVDRKGQQTKAWSSFNHLLVDLIGADAELDTTPSEWTETKIINQVIPLVIILGYKFGLKKVLQMINLDYKFYPSGTRPKLGQMDISVKFLDGVLVFNRYPLARSLIAAGLNWVKLNDVAFREMEIPDTYGKLLVRKGMTVNVLKGLNAFFDFFVDPITESVLEKMGEPITFHELLLRANVMLSDYHAVDPSSISLHRFRLYERFNGKIYNEIYRGLAQYRGNPSTRSGFSINPEAVFLSLIQDPTIATNDEINPVHEYKQRTNFTFTGSGGRADKSIVLRDRVYPKDGLGVVSDAVPDSGKVGITAYLSASPRVDDVHGLPKPHKPGDHLEPPEILSIGSMVMPGGTTDDGKRNSYLSIQLSHYVPNLHEGETLSVRTGYDAVLPHLVSDTFAQPAADSGVVEKVDVKNHVITVRYADKVIPVIRQIPRFPYMDTVVNQYRDEERSIGLLVPDTEISNYPINGVFSVTKTTNVKILDRLRCDTVDAIPDKDVARKQNSLIQDFLRGRYKAVYYLRLLPIPIKTPGIRKSYSFADVHSPISGAYILQKRVANFKEGDAFKEGDILVYNKGFFVPDPLSKQVSFKHGVIANVVLMEKGSNHEDACEISKDFGNRLRMTPCHQREIVTKNDAVVLKIVKVGDHVESPDSLCVLSDDYIIQGNLKESMDNLDIMERLSRQTPPADYTGTITKIRILYGGDREKLSESLKSILKTYEKEVRDSFKALNVNSDAKPPEKPGWIKPGTKYKGIDFDTSTVVLEFMIEEELGMAEGDKLVVANANKSIVSHVTERPHYTESGDPVDILFSTTSITNRIVASPFSIGIVEKIMEKMKAMVIDMYFADKK